MDIKKNHVHEFNVCHSPKLIIFLCLILGGLTYPVSLFCLPPSLDNSFFEELAAPLSRNAKPYVKCNESAQEEVLEILSQLPRPQNAVHLGWSIEFNYKIILTRRPSLAIICDINKRVFEFLDLFKQLLLESETSSDFLIAFRKALKPKMYYFFKRGQLDSILASYTSWLTHSDHFNFIKQMYADHRIIHFALDVRDRENRFLSLIDWIKSHGYTLDTLYLSNIALWIKCKEPFMSNLMKLIEGQSIFIDSYRPLNLKYDLFLRITLGGLPIEYNKN